jgi:hypothetical protein
MAARTAAIESLMVKVPDTTRGEKWQEKSAEQNEKALGFEMERN